MRNRLLLWNIYSAGFIFLLTMILNGCNRNSNDPGWDFFPDMFYSAAYKDYTKNPNFSDGMTMRVPVEGTVPRDFTPFEYTNDPASRIKAGKELVNPFLPTTDNLSRGMAVYTIFCIGCHGALGDGNGHLFTSGLYPLKPMPVTDSLATSLKDGEIYHTITLGLRSMGAHGSQIIPDDRWKLVLYIRKLQAEAKGNK